MSRRRKQRTGRKRPVEEGALPARGSPARGSTNRASRGAPFAGKRRKAILTTLALFLVAAGAAWGTFLLIGENTRSAALERIPASPDTSQMSIPLRQAIAGADRALRQAIRSGDPEVEIGRAAGRLGQLYHANSYSRHASQAYSLAMDFDTGNPRWPYYLAILGQEGGESESITWLLQRTVELAPEYSPAWLKLADNDFKRGQRDGARLSYERRLALSPGDPYARLGLARLAIAASQWEVAESHLEKAIETDPSFGVAHRLLASVHEHFGRRQQMKEALERADESWRFAPAHDPWVDGLVELSFDAEWLLLKVSKYAYVGDGQIAQSLINRAIELYPSDPKVHLMVGQYAQDPLEAQRAFETAISLDPENPEGHARLGEVLLKQNKPRQAERALRKALELGGNKNPATYNNLGVCLAMDGKFQEAIAFVKQALALQPETVSFHYSLASIFRAAGRNEEAVEQYRRVLELKPSHAEAAAGLAALLKQRRPEGSSPTPP